jgi:hypothetical protein
MQRREMPHGRLPGLSRLALVGRARSILRDEAPLPGSYLAEVSSTMKLVTPYLATLGIVAGLAASGCSSIHATAMRMGRTYPGQPEGCTVRFENLTFQEASAKYEQIGLVTLSGTSSEPQVWEGETKARLWPKVCEIGGTIVTPNATAGGESYLGMGTGMIQFGVWHEKPAGT